jgi:hypothetical protein
MTQDTSEEVIEMFTRHSQKPHHPIHHLREWLHHCNPIRLAPRRRGAALSLTTHPEGEFR